jgi:hypothetical protein
MDISANTKGKKTMNNMRDGSTQGDKWEEFGRGIIEQQARIAIRDWTTVQDILIRNYIDNDNIVHIWCSKRHHNLNNLIIDGDI